MSFDCSSGGERPDARTRLERLDGRLRVAQSGCGDAARAVDQIRLQRRPAGDLLGLANLGDRLLIFPRLDQLLGSLQRLCHLLPEELVRIDGLGLGRGRGSGLVSGPFDCRAASAPTQSASLPRPSRRGRRAHRPRPSARRKSGTRFITGGRIRGFACRRRSALAGKPMILQVFGSRREHGGARCSGARGRGCPKRIGVARSGPRMVSRTKIARRQAQRSRPEAPCAGNARAAGVSMSDDAYPRGAMGGRRCSDRDSAAAHPEGDLLGDQSQGVSAARLLRARQRRVLCADRDVLSALSKLEAGNRESTTPRRIALNTTLRRAMRPQYKM